MNIPKIIWQTYKSHDGIPKEAHMWMKSWQIQNPSWKQEFCNDQDIRQHISIHFGPRYLEVFDSFPLGVMRADFWRYCILYQFGGVYTDMDTICKQPIETWLPPHKGLVVSLESNHRCMCQWTIAASPRHPALKVLLDDIVANADNIDTSDPEFVHKTTGPKKFAEAILKYLDLPLELSHKSRLHVLLQKEMIKDIHIFPSEAFDGKWVQHFAASITLQNNPNYASWRRNRDQIFRKLHIRKKIAKRLGTL